MENKKIKIGVLGAGRGIDIAENFMLLDCEIVALCEINKKLLIFYYKLGIKIRPERLFFTFQDSFFTFHDSRLT